MALVLRIQESTKDTLSVHVMGAGSALTLSTMKRVIIDVLTHLPERQEKWRMRGKKAMFLESY
jgi:hypothetical protein